MRLWIGLGATAAASLATLPARATIFTYVVTGRVDALGSVDELGYFPNLDGQSFTATYRLDDQTPGAVFTSGPTGSSASGGGQVAAGTRPPLTGSLTIGGVTVAIPQGNFYQPANTDPLTGDPYGEEIVRQDLGQATKDAASGTLGLAAAFSSSDTQVMVPYSAYSAYDLAVRFTLQGPGLDGPALGQVGSFALAPASFGTFDASSSSGYHQDQFFGYSFVALDPTRLDVTAAGAVPEPGSWTYAVLGFGLAGAMARRRRRSVAADRLHA